MKRLIFIFLTLSLYNCQNKTSNTRNNKFYDFKEACIYIGLPKLFSDTLLLYAVQPSLNSEKEIDSIFLKIDYKKKQDSLYQVIDEELDWCEADTMWVNPARNFILKQQKLYNDEIELIDQSYDAIGGKEFVYYAHKYDSKYMMRTKQMILKRQYEQLLIFNYNIRRFITRSLEEGINYKNRIPKKMGPYQGIHLQEYKNVKKLSKN